MCEAVGHPVVRLKRVRIGPITDDDIRPGEFRELSDEEVAALKSARRRSNPAKRKPAEPQRDAGHQGRRLTRKAGRAQNRTSVHAAHRRGGRDRPRRG